MIPDPNRCRSGSTTAQMQAASERAIFIWCNEATLYAKNLAHDLGRHDLEILPRSVLLNGGHRLRGQACEIVIDHAMILTRDLDDGLRVVDYVNARQVAPSGGKR